MPPVRDNEASHRCKGFRRANVEERRLHSINHHSVSSQTDRGIYPARKTKRSALRQFADRRLWKCIDPGIDDPRSWVFLTKRPQASVGSDL